jgi:hypothetical protein
MNKTEEFIKKAVSVHGDKYDYSNVQYSKSCEKVEIVCLKHGSFWQTPNNHLRGKGCKKCANELLSDIRKYTTVDFVNKARAVHDNKYDYSKVTYKNRNDLITIICPIHGEFQQKASDHLAGCGCQKCASDNRKKKQANSTEQFIETAKQIHNDKYDYSDTQYINARTNVAIRCKQHGLFYQVPYVHLKGGGCPVCKRMKLSETNSSNTSEFLNKAKYIHGGKYDYSKTDYKSAIENVIISCPVHGDFQITPHNHLSGYGCHKCAIENRANLKRTPKEVFVKRANKIHHNKYDYSKVKYNNLHEDIQIICPVHGEFWQRGTHHLNGCGCPKCNQSHLENDVKNFLQTNHIPFETQKRFDWLGLLSLDFYLPKQRTAIECQGGQHFRPIEYFGGEKSYLYQVERDNRKQSLCEEHNIKILYYSNKENLKGLTKKPDNITIGLDLLQIILKGQVGADV